MNKNISQRNVRLYGIQRQIRRLETVRFKLEKKSAQLANLRLLIAALTLILTVAAIFTVALSWISGLIFATGVLLFLAVVIVHRRLNEVVRLYTGWLLVKHEQIARMELNWDHIPQQEVSSPEGHPFALDLDMPLIHRLICMTTTPQSAQRLYDWLLAENPDQVRIYERQQAVMEMSPHRLFRTRLAVYGRLHRAALSELHHGDDVVDWLKIRQEPPSFRLMTYITIAAAMIQLLLLGASRLGTVESEVWLISFTLYAGLFLLQRRRTGDLFREAASLHDMLETLGQIMLYLEARHFPKGSRLHRLCEPFKRAKPSKHLQRLAWLASGASLQGNFILWFLIHSILPLDLLVALGLYHEKRILLRDLPGWLDQWYELDALSSLATFADLNPEYTFPSLRSGEPILTTKGLGHPLITPTAKVRNDLDMGVLGTVFLITGSNMSGKSTFLRAIGVAISIAQAGGPVDARECSLSPMRLYTSMRITDSIPEGLSYFYAEVKRLRGLLDAVQKPEEHPVCFLIDEIFRGTNNRERLTGSRAYLKALVGQMAIGLIATHDLELTSLAEEYPLLQNYHFEERVEAEQLIFDYRLKEGPSTSTNALLIMRSEGLPVDL